MRTRYCLPLLLALLLVAAGTLTARPARAQQHDGTRQSVTPDFDALLAARSLEATGEARAPGRTPMDNPTENIQAAGTQNLVIGTDYLDLNYLADNGVLTAEYTITDSDDNSLTADILVTNSSNTWYKVYVSTIADVEMDRSGLLQDDGGYYMVLGPSSTSDAAYGSLPPEVTFGPGAAIFFRADRTIESGYKALLAQVADRQVCAIW